MPHLFDASYKYLFSSPELVRDLIAGFIPDAWLQSLDYATLEKVPGSYVTDDLRHRADDVIWRVQVGGDWVYLYLLIEFQSTVDKYMALRMMVYTGLLYQDLIRRGDVLKDGKLPPVLPIVLYNGAARWSAATDIAELIPVVPGLVAHYRPQMQYLVIDEGAYSEGQLASLQNLVAAVFRIEHPSSPESIRDLIGLLEQWLKDMPELKRMFAVWIRATLMRRSDYTIVLPEVQNLKELNMALAERIKEWAADYQQRGLQEGLQEGRQEGRQEGMQAGVQVGVHQGESLALQKLLARRFGLLPPTLVAAIAEAPLSEIEIWFDLAIDAPSLEAVFGQTPPTD
jgi:predicted transposase/invertase (TIGR01784 family)